MTECGKLVISLDTEIAWGRISDPNRSEFYGLFQDARSIIKRMLDMFEQYEVPATWALVGRLIEDAENPTRYLSDSLADYFPNIDSESVYDNTELNSSSNSLIHFAEVVELIRNYSTPHELGSHTYNHCFFGEVTDRNLIERDFAAMQSVAVQHGFNASSLVFPKNQVNHLEIVSASGVRIYRSEDVYWYDKYSRSGLIRKLLRQLDLLTPIAASDVQLETDQYGLCRLPGSIVFRREHRGLKRLIPFGLLSSKSIRALDHCVKSGNFVHLWWHPFNFAYKPEQHFRHLEKVLVYASELREKGMLEVLTMGEAAKMHQCVRDTEQGV